jgi:hypothetical protein
MAGAAKRNRTAPRSGPANPADFWWSVHPHGNGNASVLVVRLGGFLVVAKSLPERFARYIAYTHNRAMDKKFGTNEAWPYRPMNADLASELAAALEMLLTVATDERSKLPKAELFTDMALNGARQAIEKARATGLLEESK